MQRAEAARRGRDQLIATENAIDSALSEAGRLLADLPTLRREAGLSALHGPTVIGEVNAVIAGLAAARCAALQAHESLSQVRDNIGCRTIAGGEMDKPPASASAGGLAERTLRVA